MKKLTILCSFLFLLNACNKDDSNNSEIPEEQNIDIQENVVVILKENSQITSSEADLENGIYLIQFSEELPEIRINDIIIGDQGEGFLRKVTSVSTNENTVTLLTTQANMEDVFKNAVVEFNTDLSNSARISSSKSEGYRVNYLANGVQFSGDGFEFDFSNTTLYQEDALTFEITDGTATFNPNFSFKGDYSLLGGLDYIDFKANNAELNIDLDLSLNASAGLSLPAFSTTLADVEKKIEFLVAGVPVVVIVNTKLVAELSASIASNLEITTGITNNYILSTSAKYENDNWTGNFDLSPTLTPKPINRNGEVNIAQNLTITPKVSVKFYGVIGPYFQPEMTEDFVLNMAWPSLDWDSNLKVGLNATTGVDIEIFGYTVADFSRTDNFEQTLYNAPSTIIKLSGDNQNGAQEEQLPESLRVQISDNFGNALNNVPVYFNVLPGDGAVSNESVMTDANGFAEVFWTLGDNIETQSVVVTVKNAMGTNIGNGVTFSATSEVNLSGLWKLSLNLGSYTCDETIIMDEINAILHLNFTDGAIIFLNDPADLGLNSSYYNQTYSFDPDTNELAINITYTDPGVEVITFIANLSYDSSTNSFSGNYSNNWGDGDICNNSLSIYR